VFDYWGNDIVTDATGNANYFAPAFSGHIDFPGFASEHETVLGKAFAPVPPAPRS